MPTQDTHGRPYLRMSLAKQGQKIICDDGFICMHDGETAILNLDEGGLHFICADGKHYISGQADDGEHCIGLYPTLD